MSTADDKPNSIEIFRIKDESTFTGNDIRSELHIAPSSSTVHYPALIATDGECFVANMHMKVRMSYGMPLPPEAPLAEPDQIPTNQLEKNELRLELIKLAQRIDLLLGDDWWLPMHEASKQSGLGDDWRAVRQWREKYHQAIRMR